MYLTENIYFIIYRKKIDPHILKEIAGIATGRFLKYSIQI